MALYPVLLLIPLSPRLACTLWHAACIVLSYILNARFVFRKTPSQSSFLKFPFVYALQYGAGLLVLTLLIGFGMAPKLAMVGRVIVTVPLTFLPAVTSLK